MKKVKTMFFVLLLLLLIIVFIIIYLNRPKVGDIVTFGGNQWLVLDAQGLKAFIISEKIIEKKAYHHISADVGWERSSIREYLNSEYIDSAFTVKERKRITYSKNITRDNFWYGTYSGNDTFDKIVLLTVEDVVRYFGDSGALKAHKGWIIDSRKSVFKGSDLVSVAYSESEDGYLIHDQYDSARIAKGLDDVDWWWWTRTPGQNTLSATVVGSDGLIRMSGRVVNNSGGGVRPAMWVYLGFRF